MRDLPTKKLGVDEFKGFEPEYNIILTRQKVVAQLVKAEKAKAVY